MRVFKGRLPRTAALAWLAVSGAGALAPRQGGAQAPWAGPEVRMITDEADEALAILAGKRASRGADSASWERLWRSEAYRRLKQREAAMGRGFTDSAFRAFLLSDSLAAREAELDRALAQWRTADVTGAARLALAYLPTGSRLRAVIYPMIKPRPNSFVFDVGTDSAAIFLFLDPLVSRAKLENTLAHELHHIGYATACSSSPDSLRSPAVRAARQWMGAFSEGIAVLAAAGGPEVHPHAVSDSAERARWDRDYAGVDADFRRVEAFLMDLLTGTLGDPALIRDRGMSFFGDAQGPWYTVGYLMASTIERSFGRGRLVEVLCDPRKLAGLYDAAASADASRSGRRLPRWSPEFLARLGQ